jgi:hypothetical protein
LQGEDSEEEGAEVPLTAGEEAAAKLREIEAGKMSRKQRKVELDRLRSELGLQDTDRTPQVGVGRFLSLSLLYFLVKTQVMIRRAFISISSVITLLCW